MYVVIAYDVTSTSRRRKLRRELKGLVSAVQKSVFEGELADQRFDDLLTRIRRTIDPETDTVRVYRVCRGCQQKTICVGRDADVADPNEDELF